MEKNPNQRSRRRPEKGEKMEGASGNRPAARRERYGNYVPSMMPRRYDAFIYLDETEALHPYDNEPREEREPPETYPWAA